MNNQIVNAKVAKRRLATAERRLRFYKRAFLITASLLIVLLLWECAGGTSPSGAARAFANSMYPDAARGVENLKPSVEKSQTLTAGQGGAAALPLDPVMRAKLAAAQDYIASVNRHVDAAEVAYLLVSASWRGRLDPPANFWLLVAVARYESTFRVQCNGSANEKGLLQVHPIHRQSMARAGLDFDSEPDRLLWAAQHIQHQMAKGRTLRQALKPWTVRDRALRLFRRLSDEGT